MKEKIEGMILKRIILQRANKGNDILKRIINEGENRGNHIKKNNSWKRK